jgi:type II secretory pathway component PulK
MSLSPALTLDAAKTVAAKAKQTPFLTVQSFQQFDVVRNHPIPENKITVSSHYFLVKSSVKVNQQKVILYTLLQRILKEQKPFEVVIWQTKGTL